MRAAKAALAHSEPQDRVRRPHLAPQISERSARTPYRWAISSRFSTISEDSPRDRNCRRRQEPPY